MTDLTGHRGGRNLWPENSLEGFRNLTDVAIECVEFDVHLSDAGELIVIHDALLDRTTESSGIVRDLTPETRRKTRLKNSSECVPVLSEVLEIYAGTGFEMHVELKTDEAARPYPGLTARVLAEVDRLNLRQRSCLTCFNMDVLKECRDLAPDIRRLCSVNATSAAPLGVDLTIRNAAEIAWYVAVEKELLAAQWQEITALVPLERLGAWVANERADLEYWMAKAPGFITSDDPVLAEKVRRDYRQAAEAGAGKDSGHA